MAGTSHPLKTLNSLIKEECLVNLPGVRLIGLGADRISLPGSAAKLALVKVFEVQRREVLRGEAHLSNWHHVAFPKRAPASNPPGEMKETLPL